MKLAKDQFNGYNNSTFDFCKLESPKTDLHIYEADGKVGFIVTSSLSGNNWGIFPTRLAAMRRINQLYKFAWTGFAS